MTAPADKAVGRPAVKIVAGADELHALEPRESDEILADLAELERASDAPPQRLICERSHYLRHPETGVDVVFVPGEAYPAWAAAEIRGT